MKANAGQGVAEAVVDDAAPLSVRQEFRRILALAVPISASEVLSYAAFMITTAQVGHMSSLDLSALTLARTFFHITSLSIVIGMASGLSTLCGQAFGAKQFHLVGASLQRALVVCLATTLPIFAVWTQAKPILRLLGQDAVISGLAAQYVALLAPALLCRAASQCLRYYFTSQGVVLPLTLVSLITTAATPCVNHLFINTLDLGLNGVAFAYCALYALELLLFVAAAVRLHRQQRPAARTWVPVSHQVALSGWGPYLRVAVPSLLMLCFAWWYHEAMVIIAGALPDSQVQLGSMGLCLSSHVLAFMFAEGFSWAASTRVSNELGAGNGRRARLAALVALCGGVAMSALCAAVLIVFRDSWCLVFTDDVAINRVASAATPYLAASVVSDSFNAVLSGVLTGAGRQVVGVVTNLLSFWLLGVPLALWMAPHAGGTVGLWRAILYVSVLQAFALALCVARFDWADEAVRAQRRVGAGSEGAKGLLVAEKAAAAAAAAHAAAAHGGYQPPLEFTTCGGATCPAGGTLAHADVEAAAGHGRVDERGTSGGGGWDEEEPLLEPFSPTA